MSNPPDPPISEVVEIALDAAQRFINSPGRFAQTVAKRCEEPTYTPDERADDLAGFGVRWAKAWWGAAFGFTDAMAILADPPDVADSFIIKIPNPVNEPIQLTVRQIPVGWFWKLGSAPTIGPRVKLASPGPFPPMTESFMIVVSPAPLVSSMTVQVEVTALDTGTPVDPIDCLLDVTTLEVTNLDPLA